MTRIDTEYTATLERWWEDAEQAEVRKGDTYIHRAPSGRERFVISTAFMDEGRTHPDMRVLNRARPAWQDAPAVMAHTADDETRRAFVYIPSDDDWVDNSPTGWFNTSALIDPVPMVEATA